MSTNPETEKSVVDRILEEFDRLIERFPDSSDFLGKQIYLPKPKKAFLFKSQKPPDLAELREEVQKISQRETVTLARETIAKKLKQFPHLADLHALKAIQIFNDLSQSGISQNKVDALYDPLLMMAKALHNGGISLFNTNWFMTIYLKYLEIMRERLSRAYNYGVHHANTEVRKASERLYLKLLKIPRLMQVRSQLTILTQLNLKLKGLSIATETISAHELKMACEAIAARNPNKTLDTGKPANSVLFVTMTLLSLFSRIPILKEVVKTSLKEIPDLNRDLILQKQMIINSGRINDFLLALASGNRELARDIAGTMYNQCVRNVGFYLENALLQQPYEVDPYLKAAWIVRESRDLFDADTQRKRLNQAVEYLNLIMGKRCQLKGASEKAAAYLHDLRSMLAEHGVEP